ncbi:class I SAM-dependent methyltransferase [Streptomyces sp. 2112.3]
MHRHYDLPNDLFALFLDRTMTYSPAASSPPSRPSRSAPHPPACG